MKILYVCPFAHYSGHHPHVASVEPDTLQDNGIDTTLLTFCGIINEQKVNVMIAGGMGPKAIDMFGGFGIEVVTGVGGAVGNVLTAYLDGKVSGTAPCKHDHGDSCGGH